MNLQLVRALCIVALAAVPFALCYYFHDTLATLASGVWVLAVLAFWRWYSVKRL